MNRVHIRIDRLVLRGFPRADRHQLSAALQDELGRLLAAPGGATRIAALGSTARLDAGPIRVAAGGAPRETGLAAAHAIGGAIRR
jgi:hypothetical protein